MFIMRILSQRFLLSVVFMTTGGGAGAAYGTSIQLGKSGDIFELHIENDNCLLKVSLDKIETETVVRMVRKSNEQEAFESIIPCIDPNTERQAPKDITVSSAKYANNAMECFNEKSSARIGEYVWKQGSSYSNPTEYTGKRGIEGLWRRMVENAMSLGTNFQLLNIHNEAVTGTIARKFCLVVAHRAKLVKKLISDWSTSFSALGNNEDNVETMFIWMHTKNLLNHKSLDWGWEINEEENIEEVNGEKYDLQTITKTFNSVIFGGRAQGGSTSRVFKYTNNCSDVPAASLPDPLVGEFLIMNTLGVGHPDIVGYVAPVPYAYALSETSPVGAMIRNAKIGSRSLKHEDEYGSEYVEGYEDKDELSVESCAQMDGTLRGIEEDYVGINIGQHFKSLRTNLKEITYMIEAIAMTRQMVGLMWRFHDLGFIHGDFHEGNGAFKKNKKKGSTYSALKDRMVLIDFGFAEFIPRAFGVGWKYPMRPNLNPMYLSPWHLDGFRIGRRDDLYRVLQTTAFLLAFIGGNPERGKGQNLYRIFDSVWEEGDTLLQRNTNLRDVKRNFFDSKVAKKGGIYCCPNRRSFKFPTKSLKYLKNAMDIILAIQHPDDRPEYEEIIRELDMALLSLDPGRDNALMNLLIEDTTPLPNGDGPTDHGRQIFEIDESVYPDDPLNALGGRNKISKREN